MTIEQWAALAVIGGLAVAVKVWSVLAIRRMERERRVIDAEVLAVVGNAAHPPAKFEVGQRVAYEGQCGAMEKVEFVGSVWLYVIKFDNGWGIFLNDEQLERVVLI